MQQRAYDICLYCVINQVTRNHSEQCVAKNTSVVNEYVEPSMALENTCEGCFDGVALRNVIRQAFDCCVIALT